MQIRSRRRNKRWSSLIGWSMVAFSLLSVIGIGIAALESTPALATTGTAGTTKTVNRYEEASPVLTYSGSWRTSASASASTRAEAYAWRAGASASVTFTGTSLTWVASRTPKTGIARVTLDGGKPVLVDLYSVRYTHRQTVYRTGALRAGRHTLTIEWTGKKNSRSAGTIVYIDALDVTGTAIAPRLSVASRSNRVPTTSTTVARATTTTLARTTSTTVASTTTTTAAAKTGVYDVTSFGAKGDGVKDDSNAIQAAVNAAKKAGGGVVYLPAGTYRLYSARSVDADLGANVELFDNITVKGAGPDATVVVADLSWASAFGAMRRSNVTVQDLTLTAKGSEQDGVKFGVCKNPVIRNVVAHDIYIGIALYSCTDAVVKGCKVYDCWADGGTGIWIGQGETWPEQSVGGLLEDCEAWGTSFTSFRVAGHYSDSYYSKTRDMGVTLRNCYSHNSRGCNYLFTYCGNVSLEQCRSNVTDAAGFHFTGVAGAAVTNTAAPFVSTPDNDPYMFANYGGASSGIVVH